MTSVEAFLSSCASEMDKSRKPGDYGFAPGMKCEDECFLAGDNIGNARWCAGTTGHLVIPQKAPPWASCVFFEILGFMCLLHVPCCNAHSTIKSELDGRKNGRRA